MDLRRIATGGWDLEEKQTDTVQGLEVGVYNVWYHSGI